MARSRSRRRTRERAVRIGLAGVVVALIIGGAVVLYIGPPARFSTAFDVFAAINQRFADLKTARVHTVTTSAEREVSIVDGVTRFGPAPAHDLTITVQPIPGQAPVSSRVLWVNGHEYRMTVGRDAAPGKPWTTRGPTPEPVATAPTTTPVSTAPNPPERSLVEVIKGRTVDGVPVVGYRIRIGARESVSDITYFLDDTNTVLQEEQRSTGDTVSTTTYSGFGVPADITPPPAEQVARTS